MAYFQYTATDKAGTMVRGTMEANDHDDLVRLLSEQGLFLVTFHPAPAPPEVPPPEQPIPGDPDKPTGWANPRTRMGLEVGAIALLGIWGWLHPVRRPVIPSLPTQQKIQQ